ncbi:MAG: type IV toxin-antitoxin system AbiEi family antitoxin domain-containing protein [Deltaproteobacteria bacterium]|nr:type IV toxin-antitoxin system AbiEi family antitoxin domain-containing protein [Deltaproteobacteria bacterium]
MQFQRLLELAGGLPVIDTATLRVLGEPARALGVQLSRWVAAGRLVQLRRGVYLLPEKLRRRPVAAERVANLLVTPSYVSLERALSIYGLIPESVPLVQSITTRRPAVFRTPIGVFRYRHVQAARFWGFAEMELSGDRALVACPEKALLDLFHLSRGEITAARIESLRLQNLDLLDMARLQRMALDCHSPRLRRAARCLSVHVEEAGGS